MKKIIAISALMAAMASANALAADANLTFNGSVSTGTCVMNSADATKTLTIPDVSVSSLTAAGGQGWPNYNGNVTIGFTGCPSTMSNVVTQISGSTGPLLTGTNFAVVPASGTAQGVSLVLAVNLKQSYILADGSNTATTPISSTGTANVNVFVGVNASKPWAASAPAVSAGTYSNSYTLTFAYS